MWHISNFIILLLTPLNFKIANTLFEFQWRSLPCREAFFDSWSETEKFLDYLSSGASFTYKVDPGHCERVRSSLYKFHGKSYFFFEEWRILRIEIRVFFNKHSFFNSHLRCWYMPKYETVSLNTIFCFFLFEWKDYWVTCACQYIKLICRLNFALYNLICHSTT